jgi:excinuclease UvrABC ATPase subunit
MPEKAPSEASAEQGVVVDVINFRDLKTKFRTNIVVSVLISSLAVACSVKLDEDTFGAASECSFTDAQVTDFHDNVFTTNIHGGVCVDCHTVAGSGSYLFSNNDPGAYSQSEKEDNFCYHFSFPSTNIKSKLQSVEPHSSFSGADLTNKQAVIDWVDSL